MTEYQVWGNVVKFVDGEFRGAYGPVFTIKSYRGKGARAKVNSLVNALKRAELPVESTPSTAMDKRHARLMAAASIR